MDWNLDPIWIPLTEINGGEQYEGGDGVKAVDLTAIVQNLQVLYNTHTEGDYIDVGTVSVTTVDFTQPAAVSISTRRDPEDSRVLLDFTFSIPRGYPALTYDNIYYSQTDVDIGTTQITQERTKFNRTPRLNEDCSIIFTWMNDPDDYKAWITYSTVCRVISFDDNYITLLVNGAVRITGNTGLERLTYDNIYYSQTDVDIGTTQITQERTKFNRTPVVGEDCEIVFTWMNDAENFQSWVTYSTACRVLSFDDSYVTLLVNGAVRVTGAAGSAALTYDNIYYSSVPVAVGNLIIQENGKFNRAAALGDDITLPVAQTTSSPFRSFLVAGTVTAVDSEMTTITITGFVETTGEKGDKGESATPKYLHCLSVHTDPNSRPTDIYMQIVTNSSEMATAQDIKEFLKAAANGGDNLRNTTAGYPCAGWMVNGITQYDVLSVFYAEVVGTGLLAWRWQSISDIGQGSLQVEYTSFDITIIQTDYVIQI